MNTTAQDPLSLLFARRSVRVYSPGEISEATVTKMLEGAMAAPSAMTKDPWRFVVVREQRGLAALAETLPGGKMLATASLAIVACGDMDAVFDRQISYLLQDCSAAIENLLLAAQGLGLGACWVGIHPSEDAIRRVKQQLALPSTVVPIAAISIGHPGEQLESRTRYDQAYVHFEKW